MTVAMNCWKTSDWWTASATATLSSIIISFKVYKTIKLRKYGDAQAACPMISGVASLEVSGTSVKRWYWRIPGCSALNFSATAEKSAWICLANLEQTPEAGRLHVYTNFSFLPWSRGNNDWSEYSGIGFWHFEEFAESAMVFVRYLLRLI
jgi:hypothetical protein